VSAASVSYDDESKRVFAAGFFALVALGIDGVAVTRGYSEGFSVLLACSALVAWLSRQSAEKRASSALIPLAMIPVSLAVLWAGCAYWWWGEGGDSLVAFVLRVTVVAALIAAPLARASLAIGERVEQWLSTPREATLLRAGRVMFVCATLLTATGVARRASAPSPDELLRAPIVADFEASDLAAAVQHVYTIDAHRWLEWRFGARSNEREVVLGRARSQRVEPLFVAELERGPTGVRVRHHRLMGCLHLRARNLQHSFGVICLEADGAVRRATVLSRAQRLAPTAGWLVMGALSMALSWWAMAQTSLRRAGPEGGPYRAMDDRAEARVEEGHRRIMASRRAIWAMSSAALMLVPLVFAAIVGMR
jgi:hypothetical protein